MSVELQSLEDQLAAEKKMVEQRTIAQRLSTNPDFRKLILDEFMVFEVARLAMMSGDPILDPQQRADALSMCQGAGHLKRFLSATVQRGNNAETNVLDLEAQIEELRAEEAAQ